MENNLIKITLIHVLLIILTAIRIRNLSIIFRINKTNKNLSVTRDHFSRDWLKSAPAKISKTTFLKYARDTLLKFYQFLTAEKYPMEYAKSLKTTFPQLKTIFF